ncbi:MAG TPA: TetR/AcrR family transcriptional regulator [Candidatus Binatia bacterium]|jgi:AcrR family transcriptional regulator
MAYHHGDLRRALLQGALELLAEGGPAHLTLRGAARRAGVSVAAPYRHFADKRELLAAVAEEGFLALQRACDEALAEAGHDVVARFWRHGMAYVGYAVGNPAHYRVMFGPEIPDKRLYEDLNKAARAAFDSLRDTLQRCAGAGLFPAEQIDMRAMRAWGLVHGLASLFIDGQLNFDEEVDREGFLARVGSVLALEAAILEK